MAKGDDDLIEPKGSKLMPLMIVVNLVLVAGFGGYLVYTQMSGSDGAEGGKGKEGEAEKGDEDDVGPLHTIKGLVVNLNDPSGDRYLRASIVLELTSDKMAKEFEARESLIRDRIITFLSSLRFGQTAGAKGKEQIRKGIAAQINAHLKSGKLRGVYFTEFVVQ